jgi:hypothetical protein
MNNSTSASSAPSSSKVSHTHNKSKNTIDDTIAINEKIILTKNQYEVLNMVCNSYAIVCINESLCVHLLLSLYDDKTHIILQRDCKRFRSLSQTLHDSNSMRRFL